MDLENKMQNNPEIEEIVRNSVALAQSKQHQYVLTEHLLMALVQHAPFAVVLKKFGVDVDQMQSEIDLYLNSLTNLHKPDQDAQPRKTNTLERIFNRAMTQVLFTGRRSLTTVDLYLSIMAETNTHAHYFLLKYGVTKQEFVQFWEAHYKQSSGRINEQQANEILQEYCTNLTQLAREDRLEPVIGRDQDIQEIIKVLARRFKANVLMVGDPGVGKTAIIEGLAQRFVENDVPEFLKDSELWSLEIGSLLAGSKYRGEFEEKIKLVFKALASKKKVVLFIDEAHTMKGAGASNNSPMDFANMIKPAITKGNVKIVAATTWEEYHSSFDKDRALMRRFHRLTVDEPSQEDTVKILIGLSARLERFHNCVIDTEAIMAAVDYSNRYIHDRKNPDKSIDILDAVCAAERVKDLGTVQIDQDMIKQQVSRMSGVPVEHVGQQQGRKITELEHEIKSRLYGQDATVDTVLERIYVSFAGLTLGRKPISSFLFLGPTGTGKTELARLLAQHLDMKLLKYDMSEYQERHSVSSLIGAPPGYVGYEDSNLQGGRLISDITKNPFSVILFDEIEKAHPDVSNILLQMLDEGKITGTNGKQADCTNCIIIMTSNLGAQANERNNIGFTQALQRQGEEDSALREFFRPEFRNRIGAVCKFNKLEDLAVKKIVVKFLNSVKTGLVTRGIDLHVSDAAIEYLARKGYDHVMGARPLARKIEELITVPLSRKILFENLENARVQVDVEQDNIVFQHESRGAVTATVDAQGFILVE
jgi:ATP-dependent Clp protease ATP-binding subunit ClpA